MASSASSDTAISALCNALFPGDLKRAPDEARRLFADRSAVDATMRTRIATWSDDKTLRYMMMQDDRAAQFATLNQARQFHVIVIKDRFQQLTAADRKLVRYALVETFKTWAEIERMLRLKEIEEML